MSTQYKLVYMLATKNDNGTFEPINEHGEFNNRAAAREYVEGKDSHNNFITSPEEYFKSKNKYGEP